MDLTFYSGKPPLVFRMSVYKPLVSVVVLSCQRRVLGYFLAPKKTTKQSVWLPLLIFSSSTFTNEPNYDPPVAEVQTKLWTFKLFSSRRHIRSVERDQLRLSSRGLKEGKNNKAGTSSSYFVEAERLKCLFCPVCSTLVPLVLFTSHASSSQLSRSFLFPPRRLERGRHTKIKQAPGFYLQPVGFFFFLILKCFLRSNSKLDLRIKFGDFILYRPCKAQFNLSTVTVDVSTSLSPLAGILTDFRLDF